MFGAFLRVWWSSRNCGWSSAWLQQPATAQQAAHATLLYCELRCASDLPAVLSHCTCYAAHGAAASFCFCRLSTSVSPVSHADSGQGTSRPASVQCLSDDGFRTCAACCMHWLAFRHAWHKQVRSSWGAGWRCAGRSLGSHPGCAGLCTASRLVLAPAVVAAVRHPAPPPGGVSCCSGRCEPCPLHCALSAPPHGHASSWHALHAEAVAHIQLESRLALSAECTVLVWEQPVDRSALRVCWSVPGQLCWVLTLCLWQAMPPTLSLQLLAVPPGTLPDTLRSSVQANLLQAGA